MKFIILSLLTISSLAHTLKFHKQITYDHGTKIDDTVFGGLSGIRYDQKTKKIYAISDDRARKSPARFYSFSVNETKGILNLSLESSTILKTAKGTDYRKGSIDFEDLEILDSNRIIITSEGNLMSRYIQPPRVVVFNKDGSYVKDLLVDNKFKPVRDNGHFVSGIRNNLSFEPLSFTPSKDYLFTGTEDALVQDDDTASLKDFSRVRFIRYSDTPNGYIPSEEFVYPLGPIINIDMAIQGLAAQTGVPAFLAQDKNNLIVMERSYFPVKDKTTVLLYRAKIAKETTNVQAMPALKNQKFKMMKKELLVNLDEFLPKLSKDYKALDNIEGMCLGPKLKNGNQTLILVSDNNFSKYQRTQFLIFEIEGSL
ncbi:MAG: hypothetical protein BM556_04100 [Bacteriovorax sp. MedPE-SWde]|nr:MAG: hypothetical protein BM556_04100 [Bacteriovorax sp. MedPE-SWde]